MCIAVIFTIKKIIIAISLLKKVKALGGSLRLSVLLSKKKKIVKCRNYAKFRVCMFLALFRKAQGIDKRTNHKLGKLSCVSKFHSPLIKVNVHTNLGKKNLVMKS